MRSRSFESESQAARNNHVLEAPEPPQDHFPALTALVEHLGCPQDPSINPYRHIERLATKLAHKADTNVEQILKLSQNSPEKTRTALRDVAAALASESSYASDLGVLERDIDAARIDLEQLST